MPTYKIPPDVETTSRLREARTRRNALRAAGCSTYQLGLRDGQEVILCLCCGLGSAHWQDIRQRYCGFCQATHSEWDSSPEP